MKLFLPVAIFLISLVANGAAPSRQIAFERDRAVWIASEDGTNAKKVADGIFPAISPDGSRVAYNTEEKSGSTWLRHIAVIDLSSGKVTVFKNVPSDNSYYPSWSPDGSQILFTYRDGDVWDLGTIHSDATGFRRVKKGGGEDVTLYSPCWATDGKSIFCEDMTNIYRLDLKGTVVEQWAINKIIPNGDMGGDGRIDAAPDGRYLLLAIDMGEESNRANWDGPLPALWSFDLTSHKAVRLTPRKLFGWDGCWLDSENILFLSQAVKENEASVYRMSIDGKGVKRILENARFPSISR